MRHVWPLIVFIAILSPQLLAAVRLPEIVVEAVAESARAPTSFHHVIRPAREARQQTSVAELISRTPGTMVRELGSPGHFATTSIRGSSAEQVTVLLDGIRLNSAGIGAVDLSTIPLAAIDRIEVIRGGGTTQFGGDAIGGVVNIVTQQGKSGRTLSARISGGSFLTLGASGTYLLSQPKQTFLASVGHHSSAGDYAFREASTTLNGTTVGTSNTFTRSHNRSLAESALIKYDRTLGSGWHITALNDFFFTDRQLPGTEIETTQLAPTNPLEATQRLFRNNTHLGMTIPTRQHPELSLTLGVDNVFESQRFDDASPALGPAIARLTTSEAFAPHLQVDHTIHTDWARHEWLLRYDFRHDHFTDVARNATTVAGGTHTRQTHAVLLQNLLSFLHDRLQLLPAVRVSLPSDFQAASHYRLGVRGKPHHAITLKANIETSERVPTFSELYFPDQGFIRGNPDLAPEKAWHWDGGCAIDIPRLRAEVAYFRQYIDNSILFVPISATTIAPINTLTVRASGIESSLEGEPIAWMRLSGNYTWLRAHFQSTGKQLPGRPVHKLNGRVEFFGPVAGRLDGAFYADMQWLSALPITVENTVFLAGRATLDLGITATWTTALGTTYSASAEVRDLTNVQRYDARGFPLPRRALYVSLGGRWG
ncbi:MAG: TonB-dependent receptor [Deltaproteobacteria bacterium]|nr:TonB-dependent receptor [Deltaproteobacteria bacterium]